MNLIAWASGFPRCALCRGAGFVLFTSARGFTSRIACSCISRVARVVDDLAPMFTGATALPVPRPLPCHLSHQQDEDGAHVIHCTRGCPDEYLTPPGQTPVAMPPADAAWARAMAHRCANPRKVVSA